MKYFFTAAFILTVGFAHAQDHGFEFGTTTNASELSTSVYQKDSSASAVILNEFGEAYIDNGGDNNLIFEYHVKIKIFKKDGLDYANVEIPLWKDDLREEKLLSVKALSFTMENGIIKETKLIDKNVFTENKNKNLTIKKFAIPNVREGSVVEFRYTLESPFIYKFRSWEFQSEIPKVYSEYWATIPANYIYNTTLRGFFKLDKNERELIKDGFTPGGNKADCIRYKFGMKDIPAFKEEDYMTAKSNFVSAINFEMSEVKYFDGRVDKITKEWRDAELELRRGERFGLQLKRGKDILNDDIKILVDAERDTLQKAKIIYDYIKTWYTWNGENRKYSDGIRKAFENKKGDAADINLSLIAALKYADINVEPVILSTRENGLPIELHPVLSDFNYVVAKVNAGNKNYLLDATDDLYPFGVLPIRCLNGKGRVINTENGSYWIDLKYTDKQKSFSVFSLKLHEDGMVRGTIQFTSLGYDAIARRRKLNTFTSTDEYVQDLQNEWKSIVIKKSEILNANDISKGLVEKYEVEIKFHEPEEKDNILFNPIMLKHWEKNPFVSNQRLYPVDFGAPLESTIVYTLEYPPTLGAAELPAPIKLSLPNNGGRLLFEVSDTPGRLAINYAVVIAKGVYSSEEYHYLRELFNRIIDVENTAILLKKK